MRGILPLNLRNLKGILDKRRVGLVLALVITSLVVTGFVWAQKKVTVVADGKAMAITTFRSDPQDVIAQAGVVLGPKDEFRISTVKLINGTSIEVFRAVPVTVVYQDKTQTMITGKPTVGELAASLGLAGKKSKLVPGEGTRITPDLEIKIIALTEKLVTETQPIPPPIVRQPDPSLEKDVEELVEAGEEGVKETTTKLYFEDDQQAASELVAEKIITPAKPEIVRVGTRDTIHTSRGMMRFRSVYRMEATAYTPTDGSWHGITASGIPARRGIIAVDPREIPLGSRVYIPGYGLALAADTGSDIVGDRVDLCVETHEEAWNFGRRVVKVYILD